MTMHEASGMNKESNKFAESKLSTNEEHLYEHLPEHSPAQSDRRMQQTVIVTNPSALWILNTETRCYMFAAYYS